MSSPTLQFVVAGALVAAWAWMLGRPLLTNLFRRSRRDSVGHFRYQQAVLSQQSVHEHGSSRSWSDRPRPIVSWRSQPLERRRLQTMLGFAIATFVALLLAIALRGFFTRLFLVMTLCFVAYLGMAAVIGSIQLRRQTEVSISRRRTVAEQAGALAESEAVAAAALVESPPLVHEPSVLFPEVQEDNTLEEYDAFGAVFDEDFFEPIPGLTFEPLNLDASIFDPSGSDNASLFGDDRGTSGEFFEQLVGRDNTGESFAIDDDGWIAEPVFEGEELPDTVFPDTVFPDTVFADAEFDAVEFESDADVDVDTEIVAGDVEPAEDASDDDRREPTFTAAPVQRQRPPKRNKARPIYIESQLDEGDDQIKAVND